MNLMSAWRAAFKQLFAKINGLCWGYVFCIYYWALT